MAGYEFKRIQEGSDAGKYILLIDGVLQDGTFTMDECMARISADEMPQPKENPAVNPCSKTCPARNIFCHALCPADKAHRAWLKDQAKRREKGRDAYRYTVETTCKRMDYFRKKDLRNRKRSD